MRTEKKRNDWFPNFCIMATPVDLIPAPGIYTHVFNVHGNAATMTWPEEDEEDDD